MKYSKMLVCFSLFSNVFTPATADPLKDCTDVYSGENALSACTLLIDSHRYRGHSLSSIYNNRGIAKLNLGDVEGAQEDYKQSVQIDPRNYQAQTNLARSYASFEKFDDAIAAASLAISVATTPYNYITRAEIYDRMGQWDKSLADYDDAIKRQPIAETYYARGLIHSRNSQHEEALNDFSRAITLNNHNPLYFAARGLEWSNSGKCELAIPDYDQAIALSPHMSTAYNNRGVCRTRKGDRDGAREDYETALKYDPGNTVAKRNLEGLDNPPPAPLSKPVPTADMPKFVIPDTKTIFKTPEFEGESKVKSDPE